MRCRLSHIERLTKDNSKVFDEMELPKVQLMTNEQKVENDVVVNQLAIKYEDELIDNSSLKVSDFKIENLQATGAIKGLRLYKTKPNINMFESELVEFEKTIDEYAKNMEE